MAKKIVINDDGQNNEPTVKQITSSTQIVFTVKSFIATIGTILGIFYGFYQVVIIPKVDSNARVYSLMFDDQKKQNTIFYEELAKINNSIGALNSSVNALNNNKTDSNITTPINNTGGSLGGGNTAYVEN